ncbi:MAG: shikimate kinase [Hydrogenophaga sp.]|uniref:Shikimate kinase n=1 Tax=Hydrogenophaga crocea TaxID=2716225 RepID=A0A6G8IN18_9BURK|nr:MULTISPECIES: shikimate kinase [Hydrogenophaga]MBL0943172.1 shikimate kinase [Hydrogenophaga sp.]QIM54426.1 shikimate kinase [Hydrogenophaga crocea]
MTLSTSVFLVGLPGSGKSTVGRQLARRLGLPFVDVDHAIEAHIGSSIRTFFEREGEAAFRDVEAGVLADIAAGPISVVSTGGGAVLRPENRQCMREHGQVVYLRSSPEELQRRLRHDRNRPLLQVADPLAKLRELHAQRHPLYAQSAHFTIDTGRPSVATLVNMIVMQLELAGFVRTAPDAPA